MSAAAAAAGPEGALRVRRTPIASTSPPSSALVMECAQAALRPEEDDDLRLAERARRGAKAVCAVAETMASATCIKAERSTDDESGGRRIETSAGKAAEREGRWGTEGEAGSGDDAMPPI